MSDTLKKPNSIPAAIAAIRTLEHKGYTYTEGAELWRPPLGEMPKNLGQFPPGLQSRLGIEVDRGNYWVYQGDGHDDLKTLTCPVVIHPSRLRGILENLGKFHTALQCIGLALDLDAGSDLTTACIPAIEALVSARSVPATAPAGWRMRITGDAAVVQKEGLGGVVAHTDCGSIAEAILYALVTDILTAPSQPPHCTNCGGPADPKCSCEQGRAANSQAAKAVPKRRFPFADVGGHD